MKILFFSSNSNNFDSKNFIITTLPSWKQQFEELKIRHPENQYIAVTQEPGMFLCDSLELMENQKFQNEHSDSSIFHKAFDSHDLYIINSHSNVEFAEFIKKLKPDYAIAASFWVTPFDWLPVNDAIIGDLLSNQEIKAFYHPLNSTMTCFNKYETHLFLEKINLPVANGIYVNHDLFFCANSKKEVKNNVYKDAIVSQINKLSLPLIIKDTVGLSSYGMQIINTYGEAKNYLNSKRNNSDRVVEEYISGQQFGCEIHGTPGNYKILPPFAFSVNQYGITSPKQSVKYGPITDSKYNISIINQKLLVLAEQMKFCGIVQVDLVFDGEKWFIIEINPRCSGMSTTYACSKKQNFYEMITDSILDQSKISYAEITNDFYPTINLKIKLLPKEKLEQLCSLEGIKYVCQTEDKAAKQDREMGYCELIITDDSKEELLNQLQILKNNFPDYVENQFIETAKNMILSL